MPFRRDKPAPAKAAILGHPLHPIVIPFPIASLTGAFFTDFGYLLTEDRAWLRASRALLVVGIATGIVAGALGLIDFTGIEKARKKKVGWIHAIGNGLVLALAALNLVVRDHEDGESIEPLNLQLSTLTALLLVITGWAGGELSYRHMIGVTGRD